jgi:hypothetical protein
MPLFKSFEVWIIRSIVNTVTREPKLFSLLLLLLLLLKLGTVFIIERGRRSLESKYLTILTF